jgi:hypothetical protein
MSTKYNGGSLTPPGADGSTLVANSAASSGLGWSATASASNPVLNSAMQVAQRGTSFSLAASTAYTSGYTLDRWQTATGANQATTISRQATADTTNLPNIQYCLRFQRNSGQTGTSQYNLTQSFESINSIPFAGKTVTLSYYARAGANYSATSNILVANVITGTGTDQNVLGGYTGSATPIGSNSTLTTSWQRFTFTGTIATTATELAIYFSFVPTGTAGAADYFDVTGVQIDVGSVALPFRTFSQTLQGELAACQRYYYRPTPGGTYANYGYGYGQTTTITDCQIQLPVTMRVSPISAGIETSNIAVNDSITYYTGGTWSITGSSVSPQNTTLRYTHGSAVFTAAKVYLLSNNNNAAGYLGLSAEL